MGRLLFFNGTECAHCHEMEPLVARLEQELRIKIESLEVWHHEDNAKLLRQLAAGKCGGIPFFFNKSSGKWICGSASYEKLKEWALST